MPGGDPQSLGVRESLTEGDLGAGFNMALDFLVENRSQAQSRLSEREVCCWLEGGAKQSACEASRPEIGPQEQPEAKTYTL